MSEVLLKNIPKENQYDDGIDTFIKGTNPNNYILYSDRLWRAVSVNNEEKTVKLVTEDNLAAIPYNTDNSTAFEGSYIEEWLNDTTADGFLGTLRYPEKFIVMDAKWDATMDGTALGSITRPDGTTIVIDAVGVLNVYEYQESYNSSDGYGYLSNGFYWWTLTPDNSTSNRLINDYGYSYISSPSLKYGVRPSVILKSDVVITSGDGTQYSPFQIAIN